mmetsp:Transcript_4592/g.8544  ORF Transcript_4592/g.8544 Transcript_4592/m.8544 type:complete len:251 (+) Transcript_4592:42-794(+)
MFSFISIACAFAAILPGTNASPCDDRADAPRCEENSGSCSRPLNVFIDSILSGENDNRNDILNTLQYGRYCGASMKCTGKNLGVDQLISGGDYEDYEPDGCNPIDVACEWHDRCLDSKRDDVLGTNNPRIPAPERCECEYKFIAALAQLKLEAGADFESERPIGSPENANGWEDVNEVQLCDADYYEEDLATVFSVEDNLATPFCGTISGRCSPDDYNNIAWDLPNGFATVMLVGQYCTFIGNTIAAVLP